MGQDHSHMTAAGRGFVQEGDVVRIGDGQRHSYVVRLRALGDPECRSYSLRTQLVLGLWFLDNQASLTTAIEWLKGIAVDGVPLDVEKMIALDALAHHVIRVAGAKGVDQLNALTLSGDKGGARDQAREVIRRVVVTYEKRKRGGDMINYAEFWNLNRRPFEADANPAFFFESRAHGEALALGTLGAVDFVRREEQRREARARAAVAARLARADLVVVRDPESRAEVRHLAIRHDSL